MKFFAIAHDPAGDSAALYDGMDQAAVSSLLAAKGFPFDFIGESEYAAFIESHKPVPLNPGQILALERTQAVSELVAGTQPGTKLQRALLLTILDEINVIRALLPGPPAPRTANQLKTAVQNKINAGTAD